jgi:hypothetical protein
MKRSNDYDPEHDGAPDGEPWRMVSAVHLIAGLVWLGVFVLLGAIYLSIR